MNVRVCDNCLEPIERTPPTETATSRYEVHGPLNTVRDYHDMCIGKAVDPVLRELYEGGDNTGVTFLKRSTYDA